MKLTQSRRTYAARDVAAMAHFKVRPAEWGSNRVPAGEFCNVTIQCRRFAPQHRWPAQCPHFTPPRSAQQCVESYHAGGDADGLYINAHIGSIAAPAIRVSNPV